MFNLLNHISARRSGPGTLFCEEGLCNLKEGVCKCSEDTIRTGILHLEHLAGFAKCGIHSFDPNAIDQSKIVQDSNSSTECDS